MFHAFSPDAGGACPNRPKRFRKPAGVDMAGSAGGSAGGAAGGGVSSDGVSSDGGSKNSGTYEWVHPRDFPQPRPAFCYAKSSVM